MKYYIAYPFPDITPRGYVYCFEILQDRDLYTTPFYMSYCEGFDAIFPDHISKFSIKMNLAEQKWRPIKDDRKFSILDPTEKFELILEYAC